MKVLLISASPINKSTNIGNTFLNIFPEGTELFSLYTKGGNPDSRVKDAFCISEKMLLTFKKGSRVLSRHSSFDEKIDSVPDFAKKHRFYLFFLIRELIWSIFNWKTKELENFVREVDPNVIFTVSSNQIYLNRFILHICNLLSKPLAVYAWDNNYYDNPFEKNLLKKHIHKKEKRYMKEVIEKSSRLFVISDIQKNDYEREFGVSCEVLTKNADFTSDFSYSEPLSPIEFVYTGNLGLNRWRSLAEIAEQIKKVNEETVKAVLKIYSATPVTAEMRKSLDDSINTFIIGSAPSDEIPEIQKNAGVLIHIESFDDKSRFQARYSFSTKIVDYLSACRPVLAFGPDDVASIDYLSKTNSAVTVTKKEDLYEAVLKLTQDASFRRDCAFNAYNCGKERHNRSDNENSFLTSLSLTEK